MSLCFRNPLLCPKTDRSISKKTAIVFMQRLHNRIRQRPCICHVLRPPSSRLDRPYPNSSLISIFFDLFRIIFISVLPRVLLIFLCLIMCMSMHPSDPTCSIQTEHWSTILIDHRSVRSVQSLHARLGCRRRWYMIAGNRASDRLSRLVWTSWTRSRWVGEKNIWSWLKNLGVLIILVGSFSWRRP